MKRFVILLFILLLIPSNAFAADEDYDNYLKSFDLSSFDTLDEETYNFLEELGISEFNYENISSISMEKVFLHIKNLAVEKAGTPIRAGLTVVCFIILTSFLKSMNNELNKGEIHSLFSTITSLAISIFLVINITDCINLSSSTIKICSDFSFAFFPAFCIIVASAGGVTTSLSTNTMLLILAQGLNYFTDLFFVPITNCFLALGICSSIREDLNINSIIGALKKIITTLISIICTVFITILTFKTSVSSRADALGMRSIKFAINSVVPVIGGSISEGLLSIQNYSSLIKSSVGIVGIIAIALIFLPAIIEVNIWRAALSVSSIFADIFGDKSSVMTLRTFNDTLMIIDIILILSMVTTIISLGILVAAKTVV